LISQEAKDLIKGLLVKEASRRLSAQCVLEHPWVKNGGPRTPLITPQIIRRNNSARELSVFAESAMAVKRVVMQHFSMNLALEARLRSLDEDSGLGHEPEVEMEMETDQDLEDGIQFGFLSLESTDAETSPASSLVSGDSAGSKSDAGSTGMRKKVTFGLAPPSQSRLAQRRLKTSSLDASAFCH